MAVASDGTVYIADSQNNRIRVVSPTGLITTFAQVADPVALALGPQNTLYIVDQAGVQTVSSNRAVATLLPPPTSVNGIVGDVSVEGEVFAFDPDAITVTPSGDLYLANSSPKVLLRYSSGVMSMVGGTSLETADTYVAQDGLAVAPDGTIIVGDYGGFDLDQVTGTSISPIDKSGLNSIAKLIGGFRPSGVAVGSNGEIYTDTDGRSGATNRETLIAIDPDGKAHLLADDGAL
jgi:sugar lactone lactonase YvrE